MLDRRFEMVCDRPTQAAVADDDVDDAPAEEGGRDAAAGGLYFGELRDGSTRPQNIVAPLKRRIAVRPSDARRTAKGRYLIFDSL
jgi:hypothetical protein